MHVGPRWVLSFGLAPVAITAPFSWYNTRRCRSHKPRRSLVLSLDRIEMEGKTKSGYIVIEGVPDKDEVSKHRADLPWLGDESFGGSHAKAETTTLHGPGPWSRLLLVPGPRSLSSLLALLSFSCLDK